VPEPLVGALLDAACQAPTHGLIEPWRFLVFTGPARGRLAAQLPSVYDAVTPIDQVRTDKREKLGIVFLQAPVVIVLACHHPPGCKIPLLENQLAVACAVQNLHLAAHAAGLAAMWSSPPLVSTEAARPVLDLHPHELALGFFFVGWPKLGAPRRSAPAGRGPKKPAGFATEPCRSPRLTTDVSWRLPCARRAKGVGLTSPNPPVGAVIVSPAGEVLGKGWHHRAGAPHAERNALAAAGGPDACRGAIMYVTLEPCSTHGRTPPCVDALVEAGVSRVVWAMDDPHPAHAGRAPATLAARGIEVTRGVLAEEADALLAPWRTFITAGRPWVIAKAGLSLDGKLTRPRGEGQWITNELARQDAQRLRRRADAILSALKPSAKTIPPSPCARLAPAKNSRGASSSAVPAACPPSPACSPTSTAIAPSSWEANRCQHPPGTGRPGRGHHPHRRRRHRAGPGIRPATGRRGRLLHRPAPVRHRTAGHRRRLLRRGGRPAAPSELEIVRGQCARHRIDRTGRRPPESHRGRPRVPR
jgi:pyrimidine deaminase RibD-like protein/nitroreductase